MIQLWTGVLILGLIGTIVSGCGPNATEKTERQLQMFIDHHVQVIEPLAKAASLASYNANASGKDEDYKRSADLSFELKKVYANKDEFAQLKTWKESGLVKDSLLVRQMSLLYNSYLGSQIDTTLMRQMVDLSTQVEQIFNTYRGVVDGKKMTTNDIYKILAESKDSELRRKAWEAQKTVAKDVEMDVRKLAQLRNQAAQSLGFEDYFVMSMTLAEQDPKEILAILDDLASQTDESFRQVKHEIDSVLAKRYGVKIEQISPWHYNDPFFQEKPQIFSVDFSDYYAKVDIQEKAKSFYQEMGLDAIDILQRSDLFEREGKYPHAFCTDIDRKGDIRIMVNLRNNEYWMNALLHELGHALYSKYIDPGLPFLLRTDAHTFTTEAIAELFGALAYSAAWMRDMGILPLSDYERLAPASDKGLRFSRLVFARWVEVVVHFERELYRNPDQDLNSLWWQLVERYQFVQKPAGRNEPDWAAKIHIASYPVYYHNYLLGELLAAQFRHAIFVNRPEAEVRNRSLVGEKKVGDFLRQGVFAPGARYEWNEMIYRATGEVLTPKYFVAEIDSMKTNKIQRK